MVNFKLENTAFRGILIFLACGLLLMLFVSLSERITNPKLLVNQRAGNDGTRAESGGMSAEIPTLMNKLKESPNDVSILVHLTEHLVNESKFDSAETFIRRAVTIAPEHEKANYWLGVVLHSLNKNEEAVAALEKSISINDDPIIRRSLGLIYVYYLNNTQKGVEHLTAGLNNPNASEATKKLLREELEKVPLPAE